MQFLIMDNGTGIDTWQFRYAARHYLAGTGVHEQTIVGQVGYVVIIQQMQHQGGLAATGEPGNPEALAPVDQSRGMTDQPAPVLQPVHVLGVDKVDHLVIEFQARPGRNPMTVTLQKDHTGAHLADQATARQLCIGILASSLARLAFPVNKVYIQFRCIALNSNDVNVRRHCITGDMREIISKDCQQFRGVGAQSQRAATECKIQFVSTQRCLPL